AKKKARRKLSTTGHSLSLDAEDWFSETSGVAGLTWWGEVCSLIRQQTQTRLEPQDRQQLMPLGLGPPLQAHADPGPLHAHADAGPRHADPGPPHPHPARATPRRLFCHPHAEPPQPTPPTRITDILTWPPRRLADASVLNSITAPPLVAAAVTMAIIFCT